MCLNKKYFLHKKVQNIFRLARLGKTSTSFQPWLRHCLGSPIEQAELALLTSLFFCLNLSSMTVFAFQFIFNNKRLTNANTMFIVSVIFSLKANKCILPICSILTIVSLFLEVQGNKIQIYTKFICEDL